MSKRKKKNTGMKKDSPLSSLCTTLIHLLVVLVAIIYIYKGAVLCYSYGYRIFKEPPMTTSPGRTVTVTIPEDITAVSMGKLLESKGLSRDSKLVVLQYYCSEYRKDLKAGTYELNTSMTVEEMFERMSLGEDWEEGGEAG